MCGVRRLERLVGVLRHKLTRLSLKLNDQQQQHVDDDDEEYQQFIEPWTTTSTGLPVLDY